MHLKRFDLAFLRELSVYERYNETYLDATYTTRWLLHSYLIIQTDRSSHPKVFCKNGVLRKFTKFTGKHLCQSQYLFLQKTSGGLLLDRANSIPMLPFMSMFSSILHQTSKIFAPECWRGVEIRITICLKLLITKKLERRDWRHSCVLSVD